jgi:hypothetical protein
MTNGTEAPVNSKPRGYPGEPEQVERNDEVCRMWTEEGLAIAEIARRIGKSPTRVRQILDRRGLRIVNTEGEEVRANPGKPSAYGNLRQKSVKSCTRCGYEFTWIDTVQGWQPGDDFIPEGNPAEFPHWVDSDGTRWTRHYCKGRN